MHLRVVLTGVLGSWSAYDTIASLSGGIALIRRCLGMQRSSHSIHNFFCSALDFADTLALST